MKICIIGAGPSGIMAAIAASKNHHEIHLYDKNNNMGRKLLMTGNGRCNVSNSASIEDFLTHVHTNARFLYSAFYTFYTQDLLELLSKKGILCKEEENGRLFPRSDKAQDIVKALKSYLQEGNIHFHSSTAITNLWIEDNKVLGIQIQNEAIAFDHVILCSGGCSYPMTGSDGLAFKWLQDYHTIITPKQALVPIVTNDSMLSSLAGLSLQKVSLRLQTGSYIGDLLFTHTGLSGPLIINHSDSYQEKEIITLDLFPTLNLQELEQDILHRFQNSPNKTIINTLQKLCPQRLLDVLLKSSEIDKDTPVHQITKTQRKRFVELLKNWKIQTKSTEGWNQAMVTSGGISVKEINPKTMESKKLEHLSFGGEVIDLHADTGGYNLQIAWSTGYLAGISIKEKTDA